MCSWCTASERATKGETCADQMTDSFQAHKDVMQFLSQARAMRSALVKRLYCAVCAVFMGTLHSYRTASRNCFGISVTPIFDGQNSSERLSAGFVLASATVSGPGTLLIRMFLLAVSACNTTEIARPDDGAVADLFCLPLQWHQSRRNADGCSSVVHKPKTEPGCTSLHSWLRWPRCTQLHMTIEQLLTVFGHWH